jgi:hypothetical protein
VTYLEVCGVVGGQGTLHQHIVHWLLRYKILCIVMGLDPMSDWKHGVMEKWRNQ